MKQSGKKPVSSRPAVVMEAEAARRIRQHGRSSMKTEVCGVLIGREQGQTTYVEACIAGVNAAQGGAHVTFTQETWEHIYKIKDAEYPDDRIVGWYHSHPGFGVFLSDHDTFIQQNFFASPQQVAWVYDPHTDEEGCFGWHNGGIEKLNDVGFRYRAPLGETINADGTEGGEQPLVQNAASRSWIDWAFHVSSYVLAFVLGAVLAIWLSFYLGYAIPRSLADEYVREYVRRILIEEEVQRMRDAAKARTQSDGKAIAEPSVENKNGAKR